MGGGALNRMKNRLLSMAWEKWQFIAEEWRKQKEAFRRSLMKWIKNKMSQAYNKWWAWAEEERHQRMLLNRALNKLIKRKLAAGFTKWYEEALSIASEKYR